MVSARPILFEWHGIRFHSYPVLLYAGMTCGLVASNYFANAAGLDSARVLVAMLLLLLVGLIGSRLLYVMNHLDFYRRHPWLIWRRGQGGAAQLGGLLSMLATSVPLLKILDVPWLRFWDVGAIALLIGLAIAKIGCMLHGCCAGRPSRSRFAFALSNQGVVGARRVPSQLLESGAACIIVTFAVALWDTAILPGMVFWFCVAAYAMARLALQSTRAMQDRIGQINVQYTLCIALIFFTIFGLIGTRYGLLN